MIDTPDRRVGDILRYWRRVRGVSQMDLAGDAYVSARHLSFVETGRAQPGVDLLLRLAEVLELPLNQANALLVAAGYAPRYTNWTLEDDDESGVVAQALARILAQHEPYPAIVLDRAYDIVLANRAFHDLADWLTGEQGTLGRHSNLYRLMFAPDGLRDYFSDWPTVQARMLQRLYDEQITTQNAALARLYAACAAASDNLPDAPPDPAQPPALPVLTFALCKDGHELAFFSTVTTFGTAIDVTVQALRIESLFPADATTQTFFTTRQHDHAP